MFFRHPILALTGALIACGGLRPLDQLREIRRTAGAPAEGEAALATLPARPLPPDGATIELTPEQPRIRVERAGDAGAIASYPFTPAHGETLEGGAGAVVVVVEPGTHYLVDVAAEARTSDLHVVDPALLARGPEEEVVPLTRVVTSVHRPSLADNARVRLTALLTPARPGPHRIVVVADTRGVEAERTFRTVDRGLGGDVPVQLPVAAVGDVQLTVHHAPDLVTLLATADRVTTLGDVVQDGLVDASALPSLPEATRAELFRLLRDRLFGWFARQEPAPTPAGRAVVTLAAAETPECHAACRRIADCESPLRYATFAACTIACDSGKAARELACVEGAGTCAQAFSCFPKPSRQHPAQAPETPRISPAPDITCPRVIPGGRVRTPQSNFPGGFE